MARRGRSLFVGLLRRQLLAHTEVVSQYTAGNSLLLLDTNGESFEGISHTGGRYG